MCNLWVTLGRERWVSIVPGEDFKAITPEYQWTLKCSGVAEGLGCFALCNISNGGNHEESSTCSDPGRDAAGACNGARRR